MVLWFGLWADLTLSGYLPGLIRLLNSWHSVEIWCWLWCFGGGRHGVGRGQGWVGLPNVSSYYEPWANPEQQTSYIRPHFPHTYRSPYLSYSMGWYEIWVGQTQNSITWDAVSKSMLGPDKLKAKRLFSKRGSCARPIWSLWCLCLQFSCQLAPFPRRKIPDDFFARFFCLDLDGRRLLAGVPPWVESTAAGHGFQHSAAHQLPN